MTYENKQFEEFIAPTGRITPLVTFDPSGRLYLSSALTQIHKLNEKDFPDVKIYFNKSDEIIAIKPLKNKENGSIKLKYGKQGGGFINSRAFAIKYEMVDKTENGDFKLKDKYKGKYYITDEEITGIGRVFILKLRDRRK
ncbi:MAG: hypothetical protein WCW87_02590 [Candidatus Paceibacterota bacterium]